MVKFLIKASYTSEGVKGILKAGGTSRKLAVEKMINDLGGKLEVFYFAFGDPDVYAIGEMPDNETVAAVSLNINSTGLVNTCTTILLKPDDVDKATKISVAYHGPGK